MTLNYYHAATSSQPVVDALDFVEKISGRVEIIVDASNIFLGGRDRDFRVDFAAVRNFLGGDELMAARIVLSQPPHGQRPSQLAFVDSLRRANWDVFAHLALFDDHQRIVENEARVDGHVRRLIRAADVDTIVLLGGDGGYTNAVRGARRAGRKVFSIAWSGTAHPALVAASTDFATVEALRPIIARVLH
jgi:hypothetical protein